MLPVIQTHLRYLCSIWPHASSFLVMRFCYILFASFVFFILISCGDNDARDIDSIGVDSIDVIRPEKPKTLKASLYSNYYSSYHVILDVKEKYLGLFERTGFLNDTKESYSDFFYLMTSDKLEGFSNNLIFIAEDSLTEVDRRNLWDLNETNYISHLYDLCRKSKNQKELSDLQRNFVSLFGLESYEETPDFLEVSALIDQMTEQEFRENGIQEVCLIYIVDYYKTDFKY